MKKLIIVSLLSVGSMFGQISFGIQFGAPPPPRVVRVRPRAPGAGFIWVDGYWYPQGRRYAWHEGYWTRPPYEGSLWVGPRYEGGMFYEGYWNGPRNEHFDHNHQWDRDRRNRDSERYHDGYNHDRDHDRH
jgi:hypothetical protein